MRIPSLVATVLFLTSTSLFSAWSVQTTPTGYNLHGVSFVDASEGWACGHYGTILHTSNGGYPWGLQDSQTFNHLNSICFVDANNGWAVGAWGTILHTPDGGASPWETQTSGVAWDLYGVHFLDQSEGWVVGAAGTILHTTNGGTSWSDTFPNTDQFLDVFFWDQDEGWLCGKTGTGGTIGHTTDRGSNWSFQSPSIEWLHDIHFVDSDNGWVCGTNGEVRRTTNGEDWSPQSTGIPYHLNGIWMVDLNRGWAVGNAGTIRKTTDGGTNWGPDTSGVSVHLNGVCFTDLNNGWAVGESGTIIRYGVVGVEERRDARNRKHETRLLKNWPNPFTCNTTITYSLQRSRGAEEQGGVLSTHQLVNLSVHDLSGRLVRRLLQCEAILDFQFPVSVIWDGKDDRGTEVNSGIYLCQLRMGNLRETRKLTLLR